jgi:hypothetical protein
LILAFIWDNSRYRYFNLFTDYTIMSKILTFYETIKNWKHSKQLKFIKKGSFFILLNEEAFYFAKIYSFKITKFNKNNIKIWFPCFAKDKWTEKLKKIDIGFTFFDNEGKILYENIWKNYIEVDLSDYLLTYDRILTLDKFEIEEKEQKNFLLKQKMENIYKKVIIAIMQFPKKERFYLREKLERWLLDILEDVYIFAYEQEKRKIKSKEIFSKLLILRDFFRLAYNISNYMKDIVYLDLSNDLIEVLKITKTLIKKHEDK